MITDATLKNAARAIECDLWTDLATGANYLAKDGAILRRWDPEHDDGDALRLLGAMRYFELHSFSSEGLVTCDMSIREFGACKEFGEFESEGDRMGAIRKAIVLCAASVGAKLCQ